MSAPESHLRHQPTPDELAGIPACPEEDKAMIRPRGRIGSKAQANHQAATRRTQSAPTADDLAGAPVTAQGKEDLTVRRRKVRKTGTGT